MIDKPIDEPEVTLAKQRRKCYFVTMIDDNGLLDQKDVELKDVDWGLTGQVQLVAQRTVVGLKRFFIYNNRNDQVELFLDPSQAALIQGVKLEGVGVNLIVNIPQKSF